MVIVRKRKGNRSRGAAAVEAALVLPILLLVTFGAIKYGWLFLKAQQITNAARHGARIGIRAGATIQDAKDAIFIVMDSAGMGDIYTNQVTPIAAENPELLPLLKVDVIVDCCDIDYMFMPGWLPTPEKLIGTITMAKEGP